MNLQKQRAPPWKPFPPNSRILPCFWVRREGFLSDAPLLYPRSLFKKLPVSHRLITRTLMSDITPQLVKTLREKTNAGMMDCKKALTEADGNLDKAEEILRKKGIASATKKASRATKEGIVASYIHMQGKVGVLLEVNCETDFVAKNDIFRDFVKDITLHIAAAHPVHVVREQVSQELIEKEKAIYADQVKGKPEAVTAKIVEGKLDKFLGTICLMEQSFIKNPDQTIRDFVNSKIAELGENIVIRRFTRYSVGEETDEVTPVAEGAEV